ncbi:MAG: hypothetical protein DI535_08085 [Citrobacter freundii]|nr:MAG: hypothetical protein DI535_08085 [Citrobacter freundii]
MITTLQTTLMKSLILVAIAIFTISSQLSAQCNTSNNLALNRLTSSTSDETNGRRSDFAVDGNTSTRWSSAYSNDQSITVDLGAIKSLCQVELLWESAYATSFRIDISNDQVNWTTVATITGNTSKTNTISISGSGRYVKMQGLTRATGYGYSLYEFRVFGSAATQSCSTNLALGRSAYESSQQNSSYSVSNATDGDIDTRWSSGFTDNEYMYVDLGSKYPVCSVEIFWEAAYATSYRIELSDDAVNWTTAATITGNSSLHNTIPVSGSARYVKMQGISRATQYGYSIFELRVLGTSITLPVNWISFTGQLDNQQTKLQWITADETNNAGFEVQRKTAADTDFVTIGRVAAATIKAAANTYNYYDLNPASGANYYRIKQIDRDSHSSFSKTISVENKSTSSMLTVYPNPVVSQLFVKDLTENISYLRLFTVDGRKIQELSNIAKGQTATLQTSGLPKGTYLVQIATAKGVETRKIVKE